MITRPLDLASRLSPPPRNFDTLFYVNVGLVALFFTLFYSRFVLSPAFEVGLPLMPDARTEESASTNYIKVLADGQIYADPGLLNLHQLGAWLQHEAGKTAQPSLLVLASADVTAAKLTLIIDTARRAGFKVELAAEAPAAK